MVRSAEGFYWVALLFSDVERRKKRNFRLVGLLALKLRATASFCLSFPALHDMLNYSHKGAVNTSTL